MNAYPASPRSAFVLPFASAIPDVTAVNASSTIAVPEMAGTPVAAVFVPGDWRGTMVRKCVNGEVRDTVPHTFPPLTYWSVTEDDSQRLPSKR